MLGDFGIERPQVDEQFGYFGTVIRVNPDVSDLSIIEMFREVGAAQDDAAVGTNRKIAATLVHADDLDVFMETAIRNRQTIEDLVQVGLNIIEALTARPTLLPSGSSDGQSTTDANSTADSSSRALQLLEGRPDLQVAVLRAERQAG